MNKEDAQQRAPFVLASRGGYGATSKLQVFSNVHFGDLTVVSGRDDSKPWFIAGEVAQALGYKNRSKAIHDHVDEEDKGVTKRSTPGGEQIVTIINESGLYALIFSSRLAQAKAFKRWVTNEVLPSIRKNGSYDLGLPKDYPEALEQMAQQYRQMQIQAEYIEHTKDDVDFARAVSSSKSGVNIEEFGKTVGIGRNKLFAWLRKEKILMSDPTSRFSKRHNMPYQQFINARHFIVKRGVFNTEHGRKRSFTPLITGSCEKWLTKLLIKDGLIDNS